MMTASKAYSRRAGPMVGSNGARLPRKNAATAQFADPEQLDLNRENNRHLAFGFGIHQCAGLSLARLEGRIAVGRFLQRFPDYVLKAPPTRGGRARFRGFLKAPFATRSA